MIKSQNQQKKELVKRMRITKEAKKQEAREIASLPEIEKLKLEIENLKYYIFRYKNDMNNGMIASKVKLYKEQLFKSENKLKEVLENGKREVVENIKV